MMMMIALKVHALRAPSKNSTLYKFPRNTYLPTRYYFYN
jgi:hypothetical protein